MADRFPCRTEPRGLTRSDNIRIDGPSGPLEASLIHVDGANRIVVIVPGSGPVNRDGNSPTLGLSTNAYRQIAEGLAEAGIASLRIDKRGLFGSAAAVPDPNDVTIGTYADDALRWIQHAAEWAPEVWLAGHSEGGLVALETARRIPHGGLNGLILLATAGRPIGRLLVDQLRALPGNAALMPEIEATVATLEAGQRSPIGSLTPALRSLFAETLQGYLIDLFSHDPVSLAGGWSGPALILQGDCDLQVKQQDALWLAEALPQAECRILAGATHMLKADLPGQPYASYSDPALPLHPDVIPALTSAIRRNHHE